MNTRRRTCVPHNLALCMKTICPSVFLWSCNPYTFLYASQVLPKRLQGTKLVKMDDGDPSSLYSSVNGTRFYVNADHELDYSCSKVNCLLARSVDAFCGSVQILYFFYLSVTRDSSPGRL